MDTAFALGWWTLHDLRVNDIILKAPISAVYDVVLILGYGIKFRMLFLLFGKLHNLK